jgi:3-methyladenine DNA glycosylase AlkD
MEFFIDDENIEEQFQELFKEVLQFRNGEVHSEMKKYGLNYQKALGASVVNLKELAKRCEPNHLLAQKMWGKGFRESRIMASLLEKPQEASEQQLKRWIDEADSNELLEQMCMNLLIALPNLDTHMLTWIKSEEEKEQLCATMTVGRLALIDKERGNAIFENYMNCLPVHPQHSYLIKQLPRAIGKIARRNETLKKLVFSNVQKLKVADDKWLEVYEELQAEFPDMN